jgi:hypothetical protein
LSSSASEKAIGETGERKKAAAKMSTRRGGFPFVDWSIFVV